MEKNGGDKAPIWFPQMFSLKERLFVDELSVFITVELFFSETTFFFLLIVFKVFEGMCLSVRSCSVFLQTVHQDPAQYGDYIKAPPYILNWTQTRNYQVLHKKTNKKKNSGARGQKVAIFRSPFKKKSDFS